MTDPSITERRCHIERCAEAPVAHGLCEMHYQRLRRYRDPYYPGDPSPPVDAEAACKLDGCTEPAQVRGWCRSHYARWWHNGDPRPASSSRMRTLRLTPAGYTALAAPPVPASRIIALDEARRRRRFIDFGFDDRQAAALARAGYGFTTLPRRPTT